ncbi:unnamed protein product, partial [Prorocentrum cordatum]
RGGSGLPEEARSGVGRGAAGRHAPGGRERGVPPWGRGGVAVRVPGGARRPGPRARAARVYKRSNRTALLPLHRLVALLGGVPAGRLEELLRSPPGAGTSGATAQAAVRLLAALGLPGPTGAEAAAQGGRAPAAAERLEEHAGERAGAQHLEEHDWRPEDVALEAPRARARGACSPRPRGDGHGEPRPASREEPGPAEQDAEVWRGPGLRADRPPLEVAQEEEEEQ